MCHLNVTLGGVILGPLVARQREAFRNCDGMRFVDEAQLD